MYVRPERLKVVNNNGEALQITRRVKSGCVLTQDDRLRLVLEGFKASDRLSEICRRSGISLSVLNSWTKAFIEVGKTALRDEPVVNVTHEEAGRSFAAQDLKNLIAELMLENSLLKEQVSNLRLHHNSEG